MKRIMRSLLRWKWSVPNQEWNLVAPFGRPVATVYPHGVWHTWDRDGIGGENAKCEFADLMPFENRHHAAKREAWAACIRQGYI